MTTKSIRKIVRIDEEKCDGCGVCVPACAEGALQIIDGKAKLISEVYCDGLGVCLGECPQEAINIEEREAYEFDEEATNIHIGAKQEATNTEPVSHGCPGAAMRQFEKAPASAGISEETSPHRSMLAQWPVQLTLIPPSAPFLQEADILLAADCVPFAHANFHKDFIEDHALLVACPKLDNFQAHLTKLTDIVLQARPRSLTVVHMEVPCCSGLVQMAEQALSARGGDIPCKDVTISLRGTEIVDH